MPAWLDPSRKRCLGGSTEENRLYEVSEAPSDKEESTAQTQYHGQMAPSRDKGWQNLPHASDTQPHKRSDTRTQDDFQGSEYHSGHDEETLEAYAKNGLSLDVAHGTRSTINGHAHRQSPSVARHMPKDTSLLPRCAHSGYLPVSNSQLMPSQPYDRSEELYLPSALRITSDLRLASPGSSYDANSQPINLDAHDLRITVASQTSTRRRTSVKGKHGPTNSTSAATRRPNAESYIEADQSSHFFIT